MASKKARLSKIERFADFLRAVLGRFIGQAIKPGSKGKKVLEENIGRTRNEK